MATKTANVTARIQPENKEQAEAVLEIGIPKSVLIDSMNKEQFDAMMQKGYNEAQAGIGLSVDEAFNKVREVI